MKTSKFISIVKSSLFIALAALSVNVFASSDIYLGNPNRPGTVWQPPHCKNGCWREGYYIKFLTQPTCRDVVWVEGQYDRHGNWIPAHFQVMRYTIVNPGSETKYVGFPM